MARREREERERGAVRRERERRAAARREKEKGWCGTREREREAARASDLREFSAGLRFQVSDEELRGGGLLL